MTAIVNALALSGARTVFPTTHTLLAIKPTTAPTIGNHELTPPIERTGPCETGMRVRNANATFKS